MNNRVLGRQLRWLTQRFATQIGTLLLMAIFLFKVLILIMTFFIDIFTKNIIIQPYLAISSYHGRDIMFFAHNILQIRSAQKIIYI